MTWVCFGGVQIWISTFPLVEAFTNVKAALLPGLIEKRRLEALEAERVEEEILEAARLVGEGLDGEETPVKLIGKKNCLLNLAVLLLLDQPEVVIGGQTRMVLAAQ
ncbi:hypothetical protein RND81_11G058900 [Saponaria officinalis]|uniref:Uncharacterized protein n=1 Tax=Saponaria officinalis TaxID=3572 RepID=A0AAW1HIF3_SAPOF